MNAIIFKDLSDSRFIPDSDPRSEHIRNVLKPKDGDEIYAGIANGPLFKTQIYRESGGYRLSETHVSLPNPSALELDLYVSYARPQIAKRILFEAACFGVKNVSFYAASKGEADYAKSSLYANKEYEEHFLKGAEQACATDIPNFNTFKDLSEALKHVDPSSQKFAPDLYEATAQFPTGNLHKQKTSIIFGSERGFTNQDRENLRQNGFTLVTLGPRALRTDTAVISALALLSLKA